MKQVNVEEVFSLSLESIKTLRMALEQAITQMNQCVRLLDGDIELCEAIEQANLALNVLNISCGVISANMVGNDT